MKAFSAEDLYLHKTLRNLSGSPAHAQLAFSVSQANREEGGYSSGVRLLDTSTDDRARRLTMAASNASSPVLDPSGKTLAFLSSRGDKGEQVHLLPLDGGEARPLTHLQQKPKSILMWAPDGSRLLLTVEVPWAEDAYDDPDAGADRPLVVNYLPYKLDGSGPRVGHRTRLVAVDASTGEEQVLVAGDFNVLQAQWSPDGRQLAYVRGRGGKERHRRDVWLADTDGGQPRQLTDELAMVSAVAWSPDGRTLAVTGSRREGDSLVNLWLLDVASGKLSLPAGESLELEGSWLVWHPDGSRLATVAAIRGLHEIVVVDRQSGKVHAFHAGLRQVLEVSASGDRLAFVAASMRRPSEVFSVGWDGRGERRHTAFNRRWFAQRTRPRVVKRRFSVPDGEGGHEKIDAWLLRPPQGGGPYPLLVDFHGGPQTTALIDYESHVYWYELVSRGWAVLAANAVGSSSYGPEFARRLRGRWGELDLPQHLAIVDTLQQEGIADERVACTGKSYGGYLTAWAIGHSERFKAAVVSAPIANVESHAGTSDTGYYVTPYAMGVEMGQLRSLYHKLSPIDYCHNVSAAVLMLQGQDDQRCPLGQSEELLANLVCCSDSQTQMIVYPGGSHHLANTGKPSHRVDYHRRLAAWVQRWTCG
jgi:dipeptidyl aminopeptidase/acylaminoacyl peptidase